MLTFLGNTIEKRPWFVIGVVFLITISLGSLVPGISMETSTEDFMPDDEIVDASQRVTEYFGQSGSMLMVFVDTENATNVTAPQAVQELHHIASELQHHDDITSVISVAGFVDIICGIEYGQPLENCTETQIATALQDILEHENTEQLRFVDEEDIEPRPNGMMKNSVNLKECRMKKNETFYIFEIVVDDLSQVETELAADPSMTNVTEWYIGFDNAINPFLPFDIRYTISARMAVKTEAKQPSWTIGTGPFRNILNIRRSIQSPRVSISSTVKPYLTLSLSDSDMQLSLSPEAAEAVFDVSKNTIRIILPRSELEQYGVAPRYGSFELPAKLVNFSIGSRYYQLPSFMYSLTKNFETIQNMIMSNMFASGDISSFSDMDDVELNDSSSMDMSFGFSTEWIDLDLSSNKVNSSSFFFIKPLFFDDLKSSVLIFLSNDYEEPSGPSKTLMMITLERFSSGSEFGGSGRLEEVSKEIEQQIRDLDAAASSVSMRVTGDGIISYEMNEATMEANMIIMPSIFVVICLILLVMFKRFSYVILPLVSLGISIIWLFGTMVLLGISFNMMMVAIVPLLMGLGVDYSVHLFHNYNAELSEGKTVGAAISASIQDIGTAIFLATLTTVIAFLSFLTAGIPPLRDFGLLCAFGIIYTLLTALTFQMAARYLLDRNKIEGLSSSNNKTFSLERNMGKLAGFILRQRKAIYAATIGITIVMGIGAMQVDTTFDMNDFLPEGNQALAIFTDIETYFPSASETQEYILIEGSVASVATLIGIADTYENLKDDQFVTKTPSGEPKQESIFSLIRKAVRDNASLASLFHINAAGIPQTDADVKAVYDYLYDHEEYMMETRNILHKEKETYTATVLRIYISGSYTEDDSVEISEILHETLVQDMADYGDAEAIVTGSSSAIYSIMDSMTESQIWSTALSVLLAALILMLVFRNVLLGLISVIPVGVSIIWIVGSIYFMGYSFNIMTVMVTSLNIGIGIAFGIHVIQRFRLTVDRYGDIPGAVSKTVTHTGSALFIAALTTAAGFGMLILAPLPPEQQFGVITAMTIVYSYLTAIFVLPPLLMKWAEWRKQTKGFIISTNGMTEE